MYSFQTGKAVKVQGLELSVGPQCLGQCMHGRLAPVITWDPFSTHQRDEHSQIQSSFR